MDHDRGVAALVEFRLVRDSSNDVAGRESHCGSKGSECCDQYRDDDFDDFAFAHNRVPFVSVNWGPRKFQFSNSDDKSSIKKRSHQKSDFAERKNLTLFSISGQIVPAILRKMFGFGGR